MTLKEKIEAEELKQKALSLNLCPICGDKLHKYTVDVNKDSDEKYDFIFKASDGFDGWYIIKECSTNKEHYSDQKYDQFDD